MYPFDVFAMAEPFSPEVYFAFAAVAQKAVGKLTNTRHQQQEGNASTQSRDSQIRFSIDVPLNKLLAREGSSLGEDGYVQRSMDSPAHLRHWSKASKGYDLSLLIVLDFFMTATNAAGTPASGYDIEGSGVVGFTSMQVEHH